MVHLPDESRLMFRMPRKFVLIALGMVVGGVLLILAQLLFPWHPHSAGGDAGAHAGGAHLRLWVSLHLGLLLAIPLGLGGLYFTAVNHVAGAAWSVTIRRVAESHFWFLPFVLILMAVVLFFGMGDIFSHWVHPANPQDHLLKHKSPWLSKGFFQYRNLAVVVLWLVLGFLLWKRSTSQDADGAFSHTRFLARFSALFLVLFGLSFSASAWDLSMSLEPHWFSTMWAVYIFAGLALTTFAVLVLWAWYLKGNGFLGDSFNENHLHDLGKFMWGHTIFWAYIGVSQFLLIWYAHIPEETTFYNTRMYHGETMKYNAWAYVSLLLVVLRFILPFFLIIKRESKRRLQYMAGVAVLILVGQIVDLYWIIYPTIDHGKFVMFSWQELGPLMLVGGVYLLSIGYGLSRAALVPKKDPRLEECLHWHQ